MPQNKESRYFHVTPARNLQSILQGGLIPSIGERSEKIGETDACVFLFSDFEELDHALYNWLGEEFEDEEDLIILQIDLPKDFPVIREVDSNGDLFYEARCQNTIPDIYITAIYDERYQPLKTNACEPDDLDSR